ncbi:hypothetical protein BS50DRAFT_593495 [Corynespora cassiicola Philippines]|uniref:Uncharacterized protein n=1 Tax=Corynespora cassiicola Philippines TaxID=1448308 RepID=A0A2T2N6V2_CORCC|nr:hypothetical protein BS50DRAFT_593495 [Corynespora cassiicola Philippines]
MGDLKSAIGEHLASSRQAQENLQTHTTLTLSAMSKLEISISHLQRAQQSLIKLRLRYESIPNKISSGKHNISSLQETIAKVDRKRKKVVHKRQKSFDQAWKLWKNGTTNLVHIDRYQHRYEQVLQELQSIEVSTEEEQKLVGGVVRALEKEGEEMREEIAGDIKATGERLISATRELAEHTRSWDLIEISVAEARSEASLKMQEM